MRLTTWAVIEPLYARHDALVRQAARIVGASQAEDIVHEAFVRLARAVEEGRTGNDADNMLNQTVRNLAINHLRDNSREEPMDTEIITGMIDSPRSISAEAGLFVSNFNEVLRALPELEAQVFILVELRGLTQRETAGILDVDQSTVSRNYERARRTLARELQ